MECGIDETISTEVLVIGSGVAGVCAAIQAARLGCATTIIEKDDVLGGNSGPNLGVHISGADCYHAYASETGIIGELEEETAWRDAKVHTPDFHYNISRQWETILQQKLEEAGARVLKRHCARHPVVEGRRITAVIAEDTATFKTRRIDVSVCVIEASGDGHIAAEAGASFMHGREARSQFGERSAPEKADNLTMGASLTCILRNVGHPVRFIPPKGLPEVKSGMRPRGDFCIMWPVEHGGQADLDTIEKDHEIYEGLLKQLYAKWHYTKNIARPEEMKNFELVWISPKAGKRESRRFLGDYVLTQTDVESAAEFPDSVAYGGYAVDVHEPQPDGTSEVHFYSIPPLYNIPYRCLYSKDFDNLLLAGRLVSVTRLALGTVRLMKTGGTIGQAVGVAAWLCKKHRCTTREVHSRHLKELQQTLLKNDATIPGLRNDDPDDLAGTAKVSASSEEHFEAAALTGFLPLDKPRGVYLFQWPDSLRKVELYLRNVSSAPREVEIALMADTHEAKYGVPLERYLGRHAEIIAHVRSSSRLEQFKEIASALGEIPAASEGWVEFRFEQPPALAQPDRRAIDPKLLLCLPTADGLEWGVRAEPCDFLARVQVEPDGALRMAEECHLVKIEPRPLYGEAVNIVNGFNRRIGRCPVNMWISKRGEALPQWVELDFGRPVKIGAVHIAFDAMYEHYRLMPFNCDKRVSEMLVKDYEIAASCAGERRVLAEVEENYNRFRVHRFDPVEAVKLRLTVRAVHGGSDWPARVYEIRAYP